MKLEAQGQFPANSESTALEKGELHNFPAIAKVEEPQHDSRLPAHMLPGRVISQPRTRPLGGQAESSHAQVGSGSVDSVLDDMKSILDEAFEKI